MVARSDEIWPVLDSDKVSDKLVTEFIELERTITATPANSLAGYEAKVRVIERAEFDDPDGIIETILKLDAKRVGGAR